MGTISFLRLAVVSLALAVAAAELAAEEKSKTADRAYVTSHTEEDALRSGVDAILDSKIDLKVREVPLLDVLTSIRDKTRLNFYPETKHIASETPGALQSPVSIDVAGIAVRSVLHLILHDCKLGWFYRDGFIVITTEDWASTALETRVYPIGDLILTMDRRQYILSCVTRMPEKRRESDASGDIDTLVDLITATVAPNTWAEVGGTGNIRFLPTALALTIVQTREALEEIETLLAKLREARKLQLDLLPQPNPDELLNVSYAVPRFISTWHNGPVAFSALDTNSQRYELELKSSSTQAVATAKEFAVVIPQVIEPAGWKATGGKGEIFVVNDRLVVRQTAAVQSQIARLLSDQSPAVLGSIYKGAVVPGNTGS